MKYYTSYCLIIALTIAYLILLKRSGLHLEGYGIVYYFVVAFSEEGIKGAYSFITGQDLMLSNHIFFAGIETFRYIYMYCISPAWVLACIIGRIMPVVMHVVLGAMQSVGFKNHRFKTFCLCVTCHWLYNVFMHFIG